MNRREASAAATREALLAAARSAFGKLGYAEVSLAQIARDARATTGALYHHFADKRSLFAAVAEDIEAELVAHLMRSAPQTRDPWAVLTYAVTESLAYAARPGIANVIFKEAPSILGAAVWREIEMRYAFGQMHALLGNLANAGELGDYDPALVAGILLGSTIQAVDAVVTSAEPHRALEQARAAMLAVIAAFRKGSEA
jgi:AcrR family transcriptional regulator